MSLAASLQTFKADSAAAAARNANFARPQPGGPARTSTPKPPAPSSSQGSSSEKRSHDAAFGSSNSSGNQTLPAATTGSELMTQVVFAIDYLRDKRNAVTFDRLIEYLNVPQDARANIPRIRTALRGNVRVEYLPKGEDDRGKESYRYRPLHPVTNAEELRNYVSGLALTAQGIPVKDLKDGFADPVPTLNTLEEEGLILLTRNRKDGAPRVMYPNTPDWTMAINQEFKDHWMKCKLPAHSNDVRKELENMGITPTSQVMAVERKAPARKEKRRAVRRNGNITNKHMAGLLKEYTTTRRS